MIFFKKIKKGLLGGVQDKVETRAEYWRKEFEKAERTIKDLQLKINDNVHYFSLKSNEFPNLKMKSISKDIKQINIFLIILKKWENMLRMIDIWRIL